MNLKIVNGVNDNTIQTLSEFNVKNFEQLFGVVLRLKSKGFDREKHEKAFKEWLGIIGINDNVETITNYMFNYYDKLFP